LSENINLKYENKIINIIKKIKKGIDLFIISDYGHHFITPKIIEKIRKTKKLSLINTQINAANIGYHTINKYLDFSSAIINETELRQELRDNSTDIRILVKKFIKRNKFKNMIITRGKNGALFVNHKFDIFECPAFAIRSIDKVGAGDAMLSIASLGIKLNLHPDLILFLGSIAASISVESIGNKEHVSLEKIDRIVEYIFK